MQTYILRGIIEAQPGENTMNIINKSVDKWNQMMRVDPTIRTSFRPAEIIAIRPDGTSESTNPEALRIRESKQRNEVLSQYLRGRADLEPEVKRLESELKNVAPRLCAENDRLQSELKSANALSAAALESADANAASLVQMRNQRDEAKGYYAQMRTERDAANSLTRATIAERDQLKRQIEATKPNIILGCKFVTTEATRGTIRPDDVVTFSSNSDPDIAELANLRADRNKIADRLSKARARIKTILETMSNQNKASAEEAAALRDTIAKLHIAESGRFTDERNALVSELSQAKAELQKLKDYAAPKSKDDLTIIYDQRGTMMEWNQAPSVFVFGMPLDEVRTLKAERDGLKFQIESLLAVASEHDCEITALNERLNLNIQWRCETAAKLEAVTRALSG